MRTPVEPRIEFDSKLAPYLRLHAPGRAALATEVEESERRPEALTQTRTRQLPVDWDALLAQSRLGAATEIEVFRQEFEASWGARSNPADLMQQYVVPATGLVAAYRRQDGQRPKVEDVPANAVVLRLGRGGNTRYWLVGGDADNPVTIEDFEDYEAGWQRVVRLTTVFPKTDYPSFELTLSSPPKAAGLQQASVVDVRRPLPIDLPGFPLPQPGWELPIPDLRPLPTLYPVSDSYPAAEARHRLESSWTDVATAEILKRVVEAATKDSHQRLDEIDGAALHRAVLGTSTEALQALEASKLSSVPEGAWLFRLRDRVYWVRPKAGQSLPAPDTPEGYNKIWAQIDSIELVKAAGDGAPFSHQFLCPLHLETILAQFEAIDAEEPMAAGFAALGEKLRDRLGEYVSIEDLPDAEIERLTLRYRTLKLRARELAEAKRSLQRQAAQLGYHLALIDGTLPDGRTKGAKGRLYRSSYFWRHYSRLEPYTVEIVRRVGPFRFRVKITRYRPRIISERLLQYEEVPLERAQWEVAQERLAQAGFMPILLDLGPSGYQSADGMRLEDLMEQLDQDEALRQRVALFLPRYQQKLTLGLVKTEYLVVLRPLPGMLPIALPGAYLEESTSYRLSWRGVEIGELLTSVPLAPGESRKIEIAQEYQRSVERVQSVTTALDVSASQSWELSDAIEQTSRRETENSSSSNWNAQASGSYLGFSAGGGGGGSRSSTVRELAQTVRKTASRAARELRQSFRQEVKTSTTDKVSLSSEERTASTVTNINQGATLNIFFYRTQNVFEGALYLEQGRLLLQRSIEMVAGTGIRDYLSFSFAEIGEFIEALLRDPLFAKHVDLHQPWTARRVLLRAAIQPLLSEYVDLAPSAPEFGNLEQKERERLAERASRGLSANAMRFTAALERVEIEYLMNGTLPEAENADRTDEDRYRQELELCSSLLRKLELTNLPIDRHPLIAPSRAIYADACLGQQPATEPYSEWMRSTEVRAREAQVALVQAQARRIDRGVPDSPTELTSPRILRVQPGEDAQSWLIELNAPLPAGQWALALPDGRMLMLEQIPAGRCSIPVRLADGETPAQWSLHDEANQRVIGF